MRSFHEQEGFTPPTRTLTLPPNVLLLATHGSREIPELPTNVALSDQFRDPNFGDARQRDYSDFGTGLILEHFDPASIVTSPRYGRIAGDPNRALSTAQSGDEGIPEGNETFRLTNSSGRMPLWQPGHEPTHETRLLWLDENHKTYYEKIVASILTVLDRTEGEVLVVDLHDTGDGSLLEDGTILPSNLKRLEKYGRRTFWEAVLSDFEGKTAKPEVMQALHDATKGVYTDQDLLASETDISINEPYKGGNVTQYVGLEVPELLKKWGRPEDANRINAIQFEIPRHRFMPDEQFQTLDASMISNEAQRLHQILSLTSQKISSIPK